MLAIHNPSQPCDYMSGRTFCELESLVDNGHEFLEQMEEMPFVQDSTSVSHARLVIHEWLANLVQYADFQGRTPRITIRIQFEGANVRYLIEDNSAGFDFYNRVQRQRASLQPLPNRGMGLLMIAACTEDLNYRRVAPDRQRLEFSVPAQREPHMSVPLRIAS